MTDTPFSSPFGQPTAPVFDRDAAFDPMSALRDIHLPDPVGWWPLAPGWWMLAGLMVVLAAIAALLEWRRRQTLAYQAARALDAIARDRDRFADARAVAAEAALLMRRVLVTREGRPQAAALTGPDWRRLLGEGKGAMPEQVHAFLADAPYLPPGLPDADSVDRALVVRSVRRWLRSNA
ncbi:DUF4381 domain-containing protein [Xanthobacter pseudotagetidis]|uniref:DUF4381 domain-containing protein n=1 Tax=Xanthobacter pseudotagetidis TaxID=3119911 RepID=UPI003727D41C